MAGGRTPVFFRKFRLFFVENNKDLFGMNSLHPFLYVTLVNLKINIKASNMKIQRKYEFRSQFHLKSLRNSYVFLRGLNSFKGTHFFIQLLWTDRVNKKMSSRNFSYVDFVIYERDASE